MQIEGHFSNLFQSHGHVLILNQNYLFSFWTEAEKELLQVVRTLKCAGNHSFISISLSGSFIQFNFFKLTSLKKIPPATIPVIDNGESVTASSETNTNCLNIDFRYCSPILICSFSTFLIFSFEAKKHKTLFSFDQKLEDYYR